MPLQTIEPRRLYRQIADQLRALIDEGEFAAGTRLPPERDLAQQLGVSRPSVREALIALEVEGRSRCAWARASTCSRPRQSQARRVVAEAPLEIIRARQLIESGARRAGRAPDEAGAGARPA